MYKISSILIVILLLNFLLLCLRSDPAGGIQTHWRSCSGVRRWPPGWGHVCPAPGSARSHPCPQFRRAQYARTIEGPCQTDFRVIVGVVNFFRFIERYRPNQYMLTL